MTIINLRDFYYWYTQDEYMEVTDDVAEALRASVRYEAAYPAKERAVTAVAAPPHFETKCPEASTSLLIAPDRGII